ncbi:chromosomal replication initiator protein DnaA, partial [Klebsiella pneumoniae]|nr:chromosomal replication initiator protein DnaA [Klebsiella pneumoniae]
LSDNTLALYAPNRFVLDWVREKYINNINALLVDFCGSDVPSLRFEVGNKPVSARTTESVPKTVTQPAVNSTPTNSQPVRPSWDNQPQSQLPELNYRSNVNPKHKFDNFVEGKS